MTRSEIITRFRNENPEITALVIADAVLESWLEQGDMEVCTLVRLVRSSASFSAVISQSAYNLENEITNFYDVDEYPGGGIAYNDKRITMVTPSWLDENKSSWRTASDGTPKYYYRRGNTINFGTPPDAANTIDVDVILLPNAFDNDNKEPFNELTYLRPYHYAMVLYLKHRIFMGVIKKPDAAQLATQEYRNYIDYMNKEIDRGIYAPIKIRPDSNYKGTSRGRYRR